VKRTTNYLITRAPTDRLVRKSCWGERACDHVSVENTLLDSRMKIAIRTMLVTRWRLEYPRKPDDAHFREQMRWDLMHLLFYRDRS